MIRVRLFPFLALFAITALFFQPIFAFASETDGTIDATNKYARAADASLGSFNFGTTQGAVHVTDSALTGYAWSDYYGWINLNPTGYGVTNDAEGNLSGYAWGQNTGWVNFYPTTSGVRVSIDSSGDFSGYAWGQNVGWIVFNCSTNSSCGTSSFKVSTDWRPASSRSSGDDGNAGGGGGGGGGGGNPGGGDDGGGGDTGDDGDTGDIGDGGDTGDIGDIGDGDDAGDIGNVDDTGGDIFGDIFDFEAPVITINGNNPAYIKKASSYIDLGALVTDDVDVNISLRVAGDQIDTTVEGTYTVTYTATDRAGNTTEATRSVVVSGPLATLALQAVQDVSNAVEVTYEVTKRAVQSRAGSVVTKTVSTAGVVGGSVAVASGMVASATLTNPFLWADMLLVPLRLWGLLLATFNLKRRSLPWGTVYDSVTKQPIDPAYVSLRDMHGKEISSSITDPDGRYGFLLKNGVYKMVANKTHYLFPSKKLAGKTQDELYGNLYFGEALTVTDPSDVITKNIPLDPEQFDWNEFTKSHTDLMHFFSKRSRLIKRIADGSFYVGFVFAALSLFFVPQPYNMWIFGMYVILSVLRMFGVGATSFGKIIEKSTGLPLSFAIIRIYLADIKQELTHKIANQVGNYYALVPAGKYYVTIEKKNPDESYTLVYTSGTIDARGGIIKEHFEV